MGEPAEELVKQPGVPGRIGTERSPKLGRQSDGEAAATELGVEDEIPFEIFEPVGCPKCSNTGYKGRTGLYEVMPISSEIREMILNRCSSIEICEQAVKEGMLTLRADGVEKLKSGWTSVEEVLRETTDQ